MAAGPNYVVAWRPQPGPQTFLLQCPYDEIFYGGARGGGKTSGLLGHWAKHAQHGGRHARGILFRRTYPELEEVLAQALELYPKLGAFYSVQRRCWSFPNGAQLKLRHLQRDLDHVKYQGHQYTWMGWEEITNFPSPVPIDSLKACLRSAHGVRCQWLATGNPGGAGHNWVKARFIDPMSPLRPFRDPLSGAVRVFIPARLADNQILLQKDPGYVDRLKASGPPWLVKAWLDGLWDIVAGGMVDDLWTSAVHVLEPFPIPAGWLIDRAFDWGSSKPFSLGWWAESDGGRAPNGRVYPKGTLFRIAEWYGWSGKPNEGLRMLAVDIARKGREMEQRAGWRVQPGPADPAIFAVENGVCIADDMARLGLPFEPADAGPGSRKTGWERVRRYLNAARQSPMEEPGLFVFETCRQFLRTVPVLPRDLRDPDDVNTESEDHIGDETRYRVMFQRRVVKAQKLVGT